MRWRLPRFRFGLRTLLLAVTACAIALGFFFWTPYNRRSRLNTAARTRIDPYELSIAGGGDPAKAPADIVTILGDSRLKHWNRVGEMAFVSNTQLLSYGQDRFLRFWNADNGRQTSQLECREVALCSAGACAYYLSPDEKLYRWDAAAGKSELVEIALPGGLKGITANDKGTHLIFMEEAVSTGLTMSVWSIAERKEVRRVAMPAKWRAGGIALNHRADLLAFVDGNDVFLASLNNDEQPSLLGEIEPNNGAYVLVFTPDDARVFAGSINGDIHQWEVKTGRVLPVVKSFGGTIDSITFNSQLKSMTVTANSYVSEFDAAGDNWVLGSRREVPHGYGFTEGYYRQARAFSENGIIFTNRGPGQRMSGGPPDGITALDFSPDGRWLATGSESGEIVFWETGTWRKNRSWRGHPTMIRRLAFSHRGNILAAADDNYAALWDVETGKELRSLKQWLFKKSLVFSPDDKWLAVNAVGKPNTPIYDVASGELALELPGRPRGEMAFSPDGKLLVAAASAETLHAWDIQKKTVTMKLGPRTSSDLDVLFHPDGRRVLTSGAGLAVRVWDLAAQKEVLALTDPAGPGRPTNIALSADGTLVAAGFRDGAARLWELETGKLLQVFQLGPRSGIVDDVSFSPDGGYLATLNRNGTVYVLSLDGVTSGK